MLTSNFGASGIGRCNVRASNFAGNRKFHAKLYLLTSKAKTTALIGSSNLSLQAAITPDETRLTKFGRQC